MREGGVLPSEEKTGCPQERPLLAYRDTGFVALTSCAADKLAAALCAAQLWVNGGLQWGGPRTEMSRCRQ